MRINIQVLLLFSVLVVATCGLIYELVAGTLASYLLGDSITQFSTIIGVYLFSMGILIYFVTAFYVPGGHYRLSAVFPGEPGNARGRLGAAGFTH